MLKKHYYRTLLITCLISWLALPLCQAQSAPTNMTITWDATHGKQVTYGNAPMNKAVIPCDPNNTTIGIGLFYANPPHLCPGELFPEPIGHSALIATGVGCNDVSAYTYLTELSDATGDFSHPIILEESPNLSLTGLAHPPFYQVPNNLPAGANYMVRKRVKNANSVAIPAGPFVIGSPDPQIANLVVDQTGCPVKIQAQNQGNSLVLTGPNGYVFSYAYRQYGTNPIVFTPQTAGTYTLSSYSSLNNPACPSLTPQPVQQTVQISRNCP